MTIGGRECDQIVVTNQDNEVMAIISDEEIIEKNGHKVVLDLS